MPLNLEGTYIMRTSLKATIFALSLGLTTFAASIPAAEAYTPGDRPAYQSRQYDNHDRFDNRDQFDARMRDIERQRADIAAQEQSLQAQLQSLNYHSDYRTMEYRDRGDMRAQFAERDRIEAQIRDLDQRQNMLNAQRNDILAHRADFDRHDNRFDQDHDGR